MRNSVAVVEHSLTNDRPSPSGGRDLYLTPELLCLLVPRLLTSWSNFSNSRLMLRSLAKTDGAIKRIVAQLQFIPDPLMTLRDRQRFPQQRFGNRIG